MELLIALSALAIASWQLKLQREEIRMNSRLNALIHLATMLKDKIDHHERIIDHQKRCGLEWKGHAARVNLELRPLLVQVNAELVGAVSRHAGTLDVASIKRALRLVSDEGDGQDLKRA
ncbi:MAG: hypothetical protein ACM32J_10165 [Rhizobacter sp.]|jgi:hypothetical protein